MGNCSSYVITRCEKCGSHFNLIKIVNSNSILCSDCVNNNTCKYCNYFDENNIYTKKCNNCDTIYCINECIQNHICIKN